jgi:predicted DNA-binding transcriptional regulator YafY
VRRYAARLQELGIPVEAARGRAGGYRLRPGYKLPPLMLTDEEAVAVVVALVAAGQTGLSSVAPAGDAALQKIRRVLPASLRAQVHAVQDTLGFTSEPRKGPPVDPGTLLALATASRDRRRVRLDYTTWDGAPSTRLLDPYGLVFHDGRWYLSAHDHGRGEPRTFRLDRMARVEILRTPADPPPEGFDPVAAVSRSLARAPYRHQVEVVLDATPAEARARIPAYAAELSETDGGVLLRARAERLDGMARLLAGVGLPVRVIRPAALRDELRALAERLSAS